MTIEELGEEYDEQSRVLQRRVKQLKEKRATERLTLTQLLNLNQQITILEDMALECHITSQMLKGYYRFSE